MGACLPIQLFLREPGPKDVVLDIHGTTQMIDSWKREDSAMLQEGKADQRFNYLIVHASRSERPLSE
jgi:hypothetical protein